MNETFKLLLIVLAFSLCIASTVQASVSIAEFFDPVTNQGFYDVSVVNERVIAFAVGNDSAKDTQTTRPDWDTDPVSSFLWNFAVAQLGLPSAFSFDSIFGTGVSQAVAYWDEGLEAFNPITNPNPSAINPLGLTESDSGTTFFKRSWLSNLFESLP